jgi:hypothetical protein
LHGFCVNLMFYCVLVGSVSDSVRSVDPEPNSESGSGSRRSKNDEQKN